MKKKIFITVSIVIVIIAVVISIFINNENKQKKIDDIVVEDIVNDPNKNVEQDEIIDNSVIGTLTIPKINLVDVKICESVELETLAHSIGHFENTIFIKTLNFLAITVFTRGFLFLSGLGQYFSLRNGCNVSVYYKKRYLRLLVP